MPRLSIAEISSLPRNLRNICVNSAVNMAGAGVMTSGYTVFLTDDLHLSTFELSLTLSGMPVGMFVGALFAGRVVDRTSPRLCLIIANAVFALAMVGLFFASDPWLIAGLMCLSGLASSFSSPARSVYIVDGSRGRIVVARSVMRSWSYLGTGIGMVGGLVVLAIDTPLAYRIAILINAASSVIVAVMALRLDAIDPQAGKAKARPARKGTEGDSGVRRLLGAFGDRRFLAVTLYLELVSFGLYALNVAVPVWIVRYTMLPAVFVGLYKAAQTIVGMTLHTLLTRRSNDFAGGARDLRRWGGLSGVACVVLAACGALSVAMGGPKGAASLIGGSASGLLAGWGIAVMFLLVSAAAAFAIVGLNGATWAVSYAMRRDGMQGEYESVSQMIDGALGFVMPYGVLPLCGATPVVGWLAMGVFTLLVSVGAPRVLNAATPTPNE